MGDVTPINTARGITPPARITPNHDVTQFDCGKPPLNDWLRRHALKNEGRASRCFVTCEKNIVVGFYCLSSGSVDHESVPAAMRRNMPPSIPIFVLGRMAVDLTRQRQQLGAFLLKDAMLRSLNASQEIGAMALVVHAIDQEVVPFYLQYGFRVFPVGSLTLFMPLKEIAAGL